MPNSIIIAIVVLLAIVVIFYVASMVLRKKTEDRIIALEERKEDLFDLPVQEEIDAVKKRHHLAPRGSDAVPDAEKVAESGKPLSETGDNTPERVSRTGFCVTPARSDPPAPAMNSTEQSEGSQFSAIRSTEARRSVGRGFATGSRVASSS